jgi:hypothetical protein
MATLAIKLHKRSFLNGMLRTENLKPISGMQFSF